MKTSSWMPEDVEAVDGGVKVDGAESRAEKAQGCADANIHDSADAEGADAGAQVEEDDAHDGNAKNDEYTGITMDPEVVNVLREI